MKNLSIYVHIPFCAHKCIYCDFYSITKTADKEKYLESLLREIEFFAEKYSNGRKVISVFFGGGTPSLMETEYILKIISAIKSRFRLEPDAEITIEANPGTLEKEKIQGFLSAGINRLSLGVQSFDDGELEFLTRIHDSKTAEHAVNEAFGYGFKNINIDLIFNLPAQTKSKWKNTLQKAVSLPVSHISAYSLILEKGTTLYKMVTDKKTKISGQEFDADLYETAINFLAENGFDQYEVSNFAKPGSECIHNKSYWNHTEYIGLGTSAHSFADKKRWWNYSSLKSYIEAVKKTGNAVSGFENLTEEQLLQEYVMLSLRSVGINIEELKNKYSGEWFPRNRKILSEYEKGGFISFGSGIIKLTPQGYAVCDEILTRLE
ncbi:MAG: radical SAM family heme chaperone HemW [Ignavibacteria bacterium]|nr:radical SAM family heme chaperone HemW [Ignavibacteria bacterium]